MALITAPVLNALRTEVRRQFQEAFDAMKATTFWTDVAMLAPSTTASNTYDWLGDFPDLREWVGDRVIKDLKENAYQIPNRTFEATVGIKRTAIEDDNVGTLAPRIRNMGESAARHPDRLIAELINAGGSALCYDGQFFFDVDHPVYANHDGTGAATTVSNIQPGAKTGPAWYLLDTTSQMKPFIFQERTKPEFDLMESAKDNDAVFMKDQYLYGIRYRCAAGYGFWQKAYKSTQDLTTANFDAAYAAMASTKGDGGRPLGITPSLLVVPPALRAAANQTILAMQGANGATNTNFNAVKVLVTPWLA